MTDLSRLEARIARLHDLGEVVRAMRGLASARMKEAQEARRGVLGFRETLARTYAEVAAEAEESGRGRGPEGPRKMPLLVLITAEHGFVGAFAEQLAREAGSRLEANEVILVVGRRGAVPLLERHLRLHKVLAAATHASGVVRLARQIVTELATASPVRLLHAMPEGGRWRAAERRLVPPPATTVHPPARPRPLLHLPPPLLLEALEPELLFAELALAMIDGLVSENLARLRAMERAERNIRDRTGELRRHYHRLRQEAITTELLDIITGATAVGGAEADEPPS